jgi:hypothetical protein
MQGSLLRRRDVRLIVGAVGISALGDFLLWVPLTLHLQETTDSGIVVAALFVALWTPVVLLAPVAGLVVDRLERAMFCSSLLSRRQSSQACSHRRSIPWRRS